jgi:hypothetical protein
MSSSNDLNADIQAIGKDKFTFEIVWLCDSKFELAYYEAKKQFDNDVLLKEGFYNGIINCRIGRAPDALLKKLLEQSELKATIKCDKGKENSTWTHGSGR